MNNLLQNISFSENWINAFRSTVTVPMRQDVSTHTAFDTEFISSDGPRIISEMLLSGDLKKENFASIIINSIIPYHCPKSSLAICSNQRCMAIIASLTGDSGRRSVGFGLLWETRSTAINNLAFFARYEENHSILQSLQIIDIFVNETKLELKSVSSISATIFLSNLMGNREDKDSVLLISTRENLNNLVYALRVTDWLNWIWPPRTMAAPLRRLALNEDNKNILREVGLLEVLLSSLRDKTLRTDLITFGEMLLLTVNLAFNSTNKERMKGMGYVDLCSSFKMDETLLPSHKQTINQILWILGSQISPSNSNCDQIESHTNPSTTTTKYDKKSTVVDTQNEFSSTISADNKPTRTTTKFQVMISYNWANQELAISVAKFLKEKNINIWIDVEKMEGSTLETMASAVEESTVVLLFVSRKYKESPNCRLEGEYAYQRRKDIIPLLAEKDYRADGWLGALLGTKLWYDINSPTSLQESCEQIYKVLEKKLGLEVSCRVSLSSTIRQQVAKTRSPIDWTSEEVGMWVNTVMISHNFSALFISAGMTGKAMTQFARISRRDGEMFPTLLERIGIPLEPPGVYLELLYNIEETFP